MFVHSSNEVGLQFILLICLVHRTWRLMNIRFILFWGVPFTRRQSMHPFPRNTINNTMQRSWSIVGYYMGGFKGRVHSTERESHD